MVRAGNVLHLHSWPSGQWDFVDVLWLLPAGIVTGGNCANGSQMALVRPYPLSVPKYTELEAYIRLTECNSLDGLGPLPTKMRPQGTVMGSSGYPTCVFRSWVYE
jgi:hypothetical protein